ncbi:histidine--tRNA ligase [Patescibacteria group bacterium]|nr:histidine--tRNA ligase [Patescibacteria group bacterium]
MKKEIQIKKEFKKKQFQLVRGMKDILPEEQKYWLHIEDLVRRLADKYSFQRIGMPIVENTELFKRSVGTATDIVEKEMYSFFDKGNENISLRPEFTAGIARAYIEHGMLNLPQPVKLYALGPCFRYDKPQAGRYRQFNQINFEIIGEADAICDAQVILVAYQLYQQINLQVVIQINSIGCPDCRPEYENVLKDYLKKYRSKLSEVSGKRLSKNPLRILDSKEKDDQEIVKDAPQQVDYLCEGCREHFIQVLEYLDELEIPYALNSKVVRGLDYYTRTTFEIWPVEGEDGRMVELGGGGRYDGLAELIGGRPTPAVGFASGVERLVSLIKERKAPVKEPESLDIFLAQLGIEARKRAITLFEELYEADIKVTEGLARRGLKAQLELANKLGVKYTLILGQKELIDGTIMIRDMEGGIQEVVDAKKVILEVKKRLEKARVNVNELNKVSAIGPT